MSIRFNCPRCKHKIVAPIEYAGRMSTCSQCKKQLRIPKESRSSTVSGGAPVPPPDKPTAGLFSADGEGTTSGAPIESFALREDYVAGALQQGKKLRTCPACAEEILADAKKCRYCGEWIEAAPVARPTSDRQSERSTLPEVLRSQRATKPIRLMSKRGIAIVCFLMMTAGLVLDAGREGSERSNILVDQRQPATVQIKAFATLVKVVSGFHEHGNSGRENGLAYVIDQLMRENGQHSEWVSTSVSGFTTVAGERLRVKFSEVLDSGTAQVRKHPEVAPKKWRDLTRDMSKGDFDEVTVVFDELPDRIHIEIVADLGEYGNQRWDRMSDRQKQGVSDSYAPLVQKYVEGVGGTFMWSCSFEIVGGGRW